MSFFTFNQYFLRAGHQPERLHHWLEKSMVPAVRKIHKGPILVMDAQAAPHLPQVGLLMGFASYAEWTQVHHAVFANNPGFVRSIQHWEADDPPFESYSLTHLESTHYSPKMVSKTNPPEPRIFELRLYHCNSGRELKALHERFAGPEIKVFKRCGIHPILYANTTAGSLMPNLTWLTPYESHAHREQAWNAFRNDPEWIEVKKRHQEEHGPVPGLIQISLWKATGYSPIR